MLVLLFSKQPLKIKRVSVSITLVPIAIKIMYPLWVEVEISFYPMINDWGFLSIRFVSCVANTLHYGIRLGQTTSLQLKLGKGDQKQT